MEVDGGGPIPAGKSSGEAHGGVEKVRGVVGRALMEGIDERRPEMAGRRHERVRLSLSRGGGGNERERVRESL